MNKPACQDGNVQVSGRLIEHAKGWYTEADDSDAHANSVAFQVELYISFRRQHVDVG